MARQRSSQKRHAIATEEVGRQGQALERLGAQYAGKRTCRAEIGCASACASASACWRGRVPSRPRLSQGEGTRQRLWLVSLIPRILSGCLPACMGLMGPFDRCVDGFDGAHVVAIEYEVLEGTC